MQKVESNFKIRFNYDSLTPGLKHDRNKMVQQICHVYKQTSTEGRGTFFKNISKFYLYL